MKKLFLAITILFYSLTAICQEVITIPDPNFENELIALGKDSNGFTGNILRIDAEAITDLNLNNKSISSLSGIEHFVNLSYLYCNNNLLAIVNLGNKPNLINFQCSDNVITSIDLSNCPNLEEFFIRDNRLTSLDVSQNPNLKNLVCSSNKLTSIDVSSNSNLKFIDVSSNKLVNLNIANGNNHNFLPLFWTTIAMNALNNPALSCIKVDTGVINTIPSDWSKDNATSYNTDCPIINCNDLVAIPDANFEQALIDLGFDTNGHNGTIKKCEATSIIDLDINHKNISSLSGIEHFAGLRYLYCNGNLLTEINLGNNPNLINLHCGSNALTSIDLSNNPNLVSLHIYLNKLTVLDVSRNTKLEDLYCSSNKLTSMDVSGNTNLKFMNSADNKLLNLNIANGNNVNLTQPSLANFYFDARYNPALMCIKVDAGIINNIPSDWFKDDTASYNTDCPIINCNDLVLIPDANFEQALIDLGFDTNGKNGTIKKCEAASIIDLNLNNKSISSLSGIEHFIGLKYLYCHNNLLTELNLGEKPNLINLHCGSNALTSIDLSNYPNLASLHIYLNKLTVLDVSHNPNLEELLCSSNKLTSMDISGNTKLKFMNFADNKLVNLNIANGNNANFSHPGWADYSFDARYNPALMCIKVDAGIINAIPTDWFKDASASYNTDCPIINCNDLVAIPDTNFEQALITAGFDTNGLTGTIKKCEAASIFNLDLNSKNISSLAGIEHFVNLQYLYCQNNSLTELNLGEKPNLITLDCSKNALTSIDVSNYPNLVSFSIWNNKLTSIDVSHNPNLEQLECWSNKLTTVDISSNPKLKFMNFANNKLVNLNIANGNNVNFAHPDWANYSFDARNNPTLMCIKIDAGIINTIPSDWFKDASASYNTDCPIINCDDLVTIPDANFEQALIDLGFDTNGLTGDILKCEATSILDLDINNKNISSLSGIEHFTNLKNLYCNNNKINVLDLSSNTKLLGVLANQNIITSINISNSPNLINLHLYGNKLISLNVHNNVELKEIILLSNNLTELDVSNNPNLKFLQCNYNQLTSLNIANGNNANFSPPDWTTIAMNASNNPALSCIKVDADIINNIPSNWSKDVTTSYSIESCESLPIIYVNDTNPIGDVFTTAVGDDANPGTAALPFATIQYAISRVAVGGIIYVDAGTYAERLIVNKSLSLKGAYTGINPGTSLNRGLSESILLPSVENNAVEIMTVQASDVSIDGFLFDGDNPAFTGSITLNGVDINAGMGISNGNLETNNLIVQNNILKNFKQNGLLVQKSVTPAITGINISKNHIDNISSRIDGMAIFLRNTYGAVSENVLTKVYFGVFVGNYNLGSTEPLSINSNTIEAYSAGIQSPSNINFTSVFNINTNQISVADLNSWTAPGTSPAGSIGIFLSLKSSEAINIENNNITGTSTGISLIRIDSPYGIRLNGGTISNCQGSGVLYRANAVITNAKLKISNVSLLNNPRGIYATYTSGTALPLEFENTSISGGETGIRFQGKLISLPSNTLSGVSFSNQSKEYILQTVNSFQGQTIDVSTVNFDGITPADMTLAQLFATEDKLTHKIDFDNVGYFKLKPNEVFVTPNSFAADLTTSAGTATFSPEINRAVGAASSGDVIHVKAGTYTNQINIDKALTIKGEGKELTFINTPTETFAPPGPVIEKGVIQTSQNIGDVFIENMSVTGGPKVTPIIIQSGGSVKNCNLQNGDHGVFFRVESATKTALVENNTISAEYIGVNFVGGGLTASLINNTITVTNPYFSAGMYAGTEFGDLPQLTVTGNTISNYVTYGVLANSINSNITQNSIVGNGNSYGLAIHSYKTLQATCNWFGTKDAATIASKFQGDVNYTPWLTNGTDTDLVSNGFQPLPDICNGTPVSVILDNSNDVSCNGANNGTINISVSGGLAPYSFLWTNSDNPDFSSSIEDLTNLEPGTYQLLLTDSNGSTASLSDIVISEPDQLIVSADGFDNICYGALEGTVYVLEVSGGTAPYTYLWSNGTTTDEINGLAAGMYSITVTDSNGCTATDSYEVKQPTLLTASISNNSTACSNNATVTAVAGTPGYTYLWSNGATTETINNVPVGTYTVTVTDAKGCTTTESITLTVGEAFNPSASVTDVSCFGASNGTITVTNANGTAPFTFSKDGITFLSGIFPYSFNNLAAGTYNIAVRDANGCTGFVTKTVTQPTLLSATIITVQSTCFGQSTGSISIATAGGSGALSYSWTDTGSYSSSQKNISGLPTGNYSLTVTDNNGCTTSLDVYVPTFNEIVVSADVTNVLCRGSLTGAIDLTVSGGSGSFAYNWTGSTTSTSEDISSIGPGTNYNVTITDIGSGCFITKSYVISQPASNLSLATAKTNATGCGGSLGTITATASGGTSPYEYKLDNGIYQSSGSFTTLSSGNFTVWVKDANGCTSSKVVAITDTGSDQYESNNSKNQAKLITVGNIINARIALATDTADWFKFITPAGNGNYTLNLSHSTVNYTFNLYATGNNTPALVPTNSTLTSKQYALTGGVTYYVQITGATSYNCYDLSITSVSSARYASTNAKVIAVSELSVKAYPNPHEGLFNLAIKSPEDGTAQIQLFTILGQLLAKREVSIEKDQNTIVEFNDVGRGMILYHITIGGKEVNGKVFGKD